MVTDHNKNHTNNNKDNRKSQTACSKVSRRNSNKCCWNSFNVDRCPPPARPSEKQRASFKARLSRCLTFHPNALGPWSFKEVRKLGEGTFGKVALATVLHDAPLPHMRGKQVALKKIGGHMRYKKSIRKWFYVEQEAHSLVSAHPHIATMLGSFETKRSYYLVVEALAGGTVKEALKMYKNCAEKKAQKSQTDWSVTKLNHAGMPEIIAVTIARQVAEALAFMHDAGVAHRDLKPDNVMLANKLSGRKCSGDVDARVVDFGLAALYNEDLDGDDAAVRTTFCGSKFFMAPEVMRMDDYDSRSADVYSLGVMLYHMITGGWPFPLDVEESLEEVKMWGPDFQDEEWKGVDKGIQTIADDMMYADPDERPNAAQTAEILRGIEKKLKQKLKN